MRRVPSRRSLTRPASCRTRKCCETACRVTSKCVAIRPAAISWSRTRCRISRRRGSAMASMVACTAFASIHYRNLTLAQVYAYIALRIQYHPKGAGDMHPGLKRAALTRALAYVSGRVPGGETAAGHDGASARARTNETHETSSEVAEPAARAGFGRPRRSPMKLRTSIAIVALAAACLLTSGVGSAAAQTPLVCQWGGTQPNPTGQITLDPGLTNTPSPSALAFKGWGTVTGGGPC